MTKALRLSLISIVVFAIIPSLPQPISAGVIQCPYHEACPALLCCCIFDTGIATCVESARQCSDFCGNGGGAVIEWHD
jgi:hypothetical protein